MKKQTPKYDQISKERVRYARNLAELLWRKACQTMTAQEQELLLQYARILEMSVEIVPEDAEKVNYSFDHIAEAAEAAEKLLIGRPASAPDGLRWDDFQAAAKEDRIEQEA